MAYYANVKNESARSRERADMLYHVIESSSLRMTPETRSFFLLQVGICYAMAASNDSAQCQTLYARSKQLWQSSLIYFNEAIELSPNGNPLAYSYLARALIELGKLDDAKDVMRMCLTDPSEGMAAEKWQECVIVWALLMATDGLEEGQVKGASKLLKYCIKNHFRFTVESQIAKAWLEWVEYIDNPSPSAAAQKKPRHVDVSHLFIETIN